MADSDNTTTLPFVTRPDEPAKTVQKARAGRFVALGAGSSVDTAESLARDWLSAHAKTQALCIKQQELESLQNNGTANCRRDYTAALRAEDRAARLEQALLDRLVETPAPTIYGIIGKLTMILGECEDNTDAADFPGPHIRSVLDDLSRMAGQGAIGGRVQVTRSTA